MNKLPVYLYSNSFVVILDLDDNKGIHQIMYQRKLKIQKGFKDSIQIQFKNSDQKSLSLSSSDQYWFDIIDTNGRQLLLSKPLTILDDSTVYNVSENQIATGKVLTFDDTSGITIGQAVHGFGIPANNFVTEVSPTTVTLKFDTTYPISDTTDLTFSSIGKRGVAEVTFDPFDTIGLVASSYKFIIKKENEDGTFTPAYANTYYGITGEIEIVEDGYPIGYPIQTVTAKMLESGLDYDRTPGSMGFVFTTGWLRPLVRPTTSQTTSSAKITLIGFKGTITVEGTLDNDPSPNGQANAQAYPIFTYTTSTPTTIILDEQDGFSWTTPVTAVRFKVKPANDPLGVNYYPTGNPIGSNNNKYPNGFVDSIQYIS